MASQVSRAKTVVASQRWRNVGARLELGIPAGRGRDGAFDGLKPLFEAAGSLRPCWMLQPGDQPTLVLPPTSVAVPDASLSEAHSLLDAQAFSKAQDVLEEQRVVVRLLRPSLYDRLCKLPAPRGRLVELNEGSLPAGRDSEKRWDWVMQSLPGPRLICADIAPQMDKVSKGSPVVSRVVTALSTDARGGTRHWWFPEELSWLQEVSGIRPNVRGVAIFGDVCDSIPAKELLLPGLNTSCLNVVQGWWLESLVSQFDQPDGSCRHWISNFERAITARSALSLASKGYGVQSFGMGMISVRVDDDAKVPEELVAWAVRNNSQVLNNEGCVGVADIDTADLPQRARESVIYNQLLSAPNPAQLSRLVTRSS